jgi:elongation factor G
MQKEDPTFTADVSGETGQLLISGMGELHLEVICERMRTDFKLKIRTGKPRVSYRETPKKAVTAIGECDRQIAGGALYAKVAVRIEPFKTESVEGKPAETFKFINKYQSETLPPDMLAVIEDALRQECTGGGMSGFPLTEIQATLLDADYRPGDSNEQAYRFAVSHAVRTGLEQSGSDLLEPIMKLEVTTPEEYIGDVSGDLSARRAVIQDILMRNRVRVILSTVPLREMFGYSTKLRTLTQGRGSYSMETHDYRPAPADVVRELIS